MASVDDRSLSTGMFPKQLMLLLAYYLSEQPRIPIVATKQHLSKQFKKRKLEDIVRNIDKDLGDIVRKIDKNSSFDETAARKFLVACQNGFEPTMKWPSISYEFQMYSNLRCAFVRHFKKVKQNRRQQVGFSTWPSTHSQLLAELECMQVALDAARQTQNAPSSSTWKVGGWCTPLLAIVRTWSSDIARPLQEAVDTNDLEGLEQVCSASPDVTLAARDLCQEILTGKFCVWTVLETTVQSNIDVLQEMLLAKAFPLPHHILWRKQGNFFTACCGLGSPFAAVYLLSIENGFNF